MDASQSSSLMTLLGGILALGAVVVGIIRHHWAKASDIDTKVRIVSTTVFIAAMTCTARTDGIRHQ